MVCSSSYKIPYLVTTELGVGVFESVTHKGSSMSAYSDLRESAAEHEEMRVHLDPSQNKELDDSFKSGQRWLKVAYGLAALMVLALAIATM